MEIRNGAIIKQPSPTEEIRSVAFKETVCELPDEEVLITWKQELHWKQAKEIGDGMSLIYVTQRPFVTYDLDQQAFLAALSIYHDYDEETDSHHTYLYKFPKGAPVEELNKLLGSLGSKVTAQEGRFVELTGAEIKQRDVDELLHYLKVGRVETTLSFLFGLVVGYGKLRFADEVLHHATISLPQVGPIVQCQEVINACLQLLEDHGVFTITNILTDGAANVAQVSIADWEVLYHIAKRYAPVKEFATISKRVQIEQLKGEVSEWLREQRADEELLEEIDYSVLKLLQK